MEIVSVVLQAVGIAMVVYGLVLASGNGLGRALINRRHTKVNLAA
ncbi:MAG TPA: hypothetical protein VIQ28_03955 [Burkholderiales bacterium]